jgi:ABC-type uncharacterized transport system substrate-binding protein
MPGKPILSIAVFLLFSGLYSQTVHAHPHYWIDLKTDMVLDQGGRLVTIKQHWTFDAYFSMITVADVTNEHGKVAVGLKMMADKMVNNLAKYGYFSVLTIDGTEVVLPPPTSYQLTENTQLREPVLELEMRFDLSAPATIENKQVVWSVFDPSYYIAMNHSKVDRLSIKGGKADQCHLNLDIPEPSKELIEYAVNLDRTRKDTDGLGASFAEKIRINCISSSS